jgi:hypothetical protein
MPPRGDSYPYKPDAGDNDGGQLAAGEKKALTFGRISSNRDALSFAPTQAFFRAMEKRVPFFRAGSSAKAGEYEVTDPDPVEVQGLLEEQSSGRSSSESWTRPWDKEDLPDTHLLPEGHPKEEKGSDNMGGKQPEQALLDPEDPSAKIARMVYEVTQAFDNEMISKKSFADRMELLLEGSAALTPKERLMYKDLYDRGESVDLGDGNWNFLDDAGRFFRACQVFKRALEGKCSLSGKNLESLACPIEDERLDKLIKGLSSATTNIFNKEGYMRRVMAHVYVMHEWVNKHTRELLFVSEGTSEVSEPSSATRTQTEKKPVSLPDLPKGRDPYPPAGGSKKPETFLTASTEKLGECTTALQEDNERVRNKQ